MKNTEIKMKRKFVKVESKNKELKVQLDMKKLGRKLADQPF